MPVGSGPAPAERPLVLRGVRKRWGAREVLAGIDLAPPQGTLVRITGANGAGKTTLLRIAAGVLRADEGAASVRALDPERDRRAYLSRVGFLAAGDRGLYARLSVVGHLRLAADLALLAGGSRQRAVERSLDEFDLEAVADRRVDRLSLGQRQRTRLALSFLHDPDVVLLDEPANSLDDHGLAVLATALERLRAHGGVAVWCAPATVGVPMPFDERHVLESGALHPE